MTLNFVAIEDLEESVDNLCELNDLREMYLLGNPCTDWPDWKDYVVARCVNLGRLDGDEVTKTWRLKAQ
jgi:protein TilB